MHVQIQKAALSWLGMLICICLSSMRLKSGLKAGLAFALKIALNIALKIGLKTVLHMRIQLLI